MQLALYKQKAQSIFHHIQLHPWTFAPTYSQHYLLVNCWFLCYQILLFLSLTLLRQPLGLAFDNAFYMGSCLPSLTDILVLFFFQLCGLWPPKINTLFFFWLSLDSRNSYPLISKFSLVPWVETGYGIFKVKPLTIHICSKSLSCPFLSL